jgi:hypothetical protein
MEGSKIRPESVPDFTVVDARMHSETFFSFACFCDLFD